MKQEILKAVKQKIEANTKSKMKDIKLNVSIAGYRAAQNPNASHKMKVFAKRHKGKQERILGDSWDWNVSGVSKTEMEKLLIQWFGHLRDIKVTEIN